MAHVADDADDLEPWTLNAPYLDELTERIRARPDRPSALLSNHHHHLAVGAIGIGE